MLGLGDAIFFHLFLDGKVMESVITAVLLLTSCKCPSPGKKMRARVQALREEGCETPWLWGPTALSCAHTHLQPPQKPSLCNHSSSSEESPGAGETAEAIAADHCQSWETTRCWKRPEAHLYAASWHTRPRCSRGQTPKQIPLRAQENHSHLLQTTTTKSPK